MIVSLSIDTVLYFKLLSSFYFEIIYFVVILVPSQNAKENCKKQEEKKVPCKKNQ